MPRTKQSVTALAYDKRGRLLAVGHNSYKKTHPLQKKYAAFSKKPGRIYLHAELACLLKASKRGRVHKLVIERTSKAGSPMFSAPCEGCRIAISDFNVKEVVHT